MNLKGIETRLRKEFAEGRVAEIMAIIMEESVAIEKPLELVAIPKLAKELNYCSKTLYRLVQANPQIKQYRLGGSSYQFRVSKPDIMALVTK